VADLGQAIPVIPRVGGNVGIAGVQYAVGADESSGAVDPIPVMFDAPETFGVYDSELG
jgi:hypothetical protein